MRRGKSKKKTGAVRLEKVDPVSHPKRVISHRRSISETSLADLSKEKVEFRAKFVTEAKHEGGVWLKNEKGKWVLKASLVYVFPADF